MLQHKIYSYTPAGDVSQIVDQVKSVTHTYTYDKLHRLISEGGTDTYANLQPAILTNSYDTQNGPIHAVAEVNLNGTDVTPDYVYDANGNLTSGPDFTDMNNIGTRTIDYNADNKPYHVEHSGNGAVMDLYYDGGGGRTKKVVTQGSTTYYFGDHYEIKDGDATKYIFAGNLRIAQIVGANGNSPEYFHKDHLGSSSVMTNDQGTVLEQTDYLPFGEMREHSGTEVSNYKFTDQELDPESGLYNYDARMYDPVIGLFVTADIVVPDFSDPQSLNRFAYCRNNPLSYVDPDGHFFVELGIILAHVAIGAAVGAAIGSAFAAITGQDIGQGALTGAITGGFFGGAGGICHVAGIGGVTQAGIHVIAGMASGAVNASITGGDMGMGILTSGLSAGVAKYAGGFMDKWNWNWGEQFVGRSIVGGITGGIAAEMYGGKFMDGFVMGAESAAFGMVCNEGGSKLWKYISVTWSKMWGLKGEATSLGGEHTYPMRIHTYSRGVSFDLYIGDQADPYSEKVIEGGVTGLGRGGIGSIGGYRIFDQNGVMTERGGVALHVGLAYGIPFGYASTTFPEPNRPVSNFSDKEMYFTAPQK